MKIPESLADFFRTMQEEPWFGGDVVDAFSVDSEGNNMISHAITYGNVDIIRCLIEIGVDINQPGEWGNTPLYTAIVFDKYDLACYLLAMGAEGDKQNDDGVSAFDLLKQKIFNKSNYDVEKRVSQ